MTADISDLIELVREGDPDAARQLAKAVERALAEPDRRVAAAFRLRRRGGISDEQATRIAERDNAIRALARLSLPDLTLEQQARMVHRKAERFAATTWWANIPDGDAERALLRHILASGRVPKLRQMKTILKRGSDS